MAEGEEIRGGTAMNIALGVAKDEMVIMPDVGQKALLEGHEVMEDVV